MTDQLAPTFSNLPSDFAITEEVEISGHIIDSLILPKVLDSITANGGRFRIANVVIGQSRHDPSYAVIEVGSPTEAVMEKVRDLNRIHSRIREITMGTVATLAKSLPPDAKSKFAQYIRNCEPGSGACGPGRGRGPYGDVRLEK